MNALLLDGPPDDAGRWYYRGYGAIIRDALPSVAAGRLSKAYAPTVSAVSDGLVTRREERPPSKHARLADVHGRGRCAPSTILRSRLGERVHEQDGEPAVR